MPSPRLRPPFSTCVVCGATFRSRTGRNRLNLYCSISCARRQSPPKNPDRAGRERAETLFPLGQPCEVCGKPYGGRGVVDRHHRDSNRLNNDPSNIAWLCRRHHHDAHRQSDGKIGGGPRPRVNALQRSRAIEQARVAAAMIAAGSTLSETAAQLGVHPTSILRWFRKYDLT